MCLLMRPAMAMCFYRANIWAVIGTGRWEDVFNNTPLFEGTTWRMSIIKFSI